MEVIALDRGRPATAGVLQRVTGVELSGVYGIARAEDGLRFETPESSTYVPGAFAWVEALWRGAGSTGLLGGVGATGAFATPVPGGGGPD